jgi:hypothetical protein
VHIPWLEKIGCTPWVLGCGLRLDDFEGRHWVGFHDTGHGHQFFGHIEKETSDGFIWHWIEYDGDQGMVRFEALDLPTFEKEIRPHIIGWLPDKFASTEELWEFYRRVYERTGFAC